MVISEEDKKELNIIEWPTINISHINDLDYERLNEMFSRMKRNGSRCTVNNVIEYITERQGAPKFPPWTLENITKLAQKYLPLRD